MARFTLDDCVHMCLRNGNWWTFWDLQRVIKTNTGTFYGEPSISAAIRNIRKYKCRQRYNLPLTGELILKRRIDNKQGYEYRLTLEREVLDTFKKLNSYT